MPKPVQPKAALNFLGFGLNFAKNWAPALAGWGVAGGVGAAYFTDNWLGHNVFRYIPVLGQRYAWSFELGKEEE